MRGYAVAAVALAGLAFAWTPVAERIDLALLDAQIRILRKFAPRPAPDDIIIIGIDEASVAAIPEPLALWHEPLGKVLARVAAVKPRAIGLDFVLPDRSYEQLRAGLDKVLLAGLLSARENGVLVAALTINPRTRAANQIHAPFLMVLNEERLGIGLFGRDADDRVRQFSLAVPTQDSAFPTLAGRLCYALSKGCRDGYIDFAFGNPFRYVPFHEVLATKDPEYLAKLFKDRIVLIGPTQRFTGRVDVPVNLAGWEDGGQTSPGVVVHAAALRSALHGDPPRAARKPVLLLLVAGAALLALLRDWRLAVPSAIVAGVLLFVTGIFALRSGLVLDLGATLFTLALAAAATCRLFRIRPADKPKDPGPPPGA